MSLLCTYVYTYIHTTINKQYVCVCILKFNIGCFQTTSYFPIPQKGKVQFPSSAFPYIALFFCNNWITTIQTWIHESHIFILNSCPLIVSNALEVIAKHCYHTSHQKPEVNTNSKKRKKKSPASLDESGLFNQFNFITKSSPSPELSESEGMGRAGCVAVAQGPVSPLATRRFAGSAWQGVQSCTASPPPSLARSPVSLTFYGTSFHNKPVSVIHPPYLILFLLPAFYVHFTAFSSGPFPHHPGALSSLLPSYTLDWWSQNWSSIF